MRQARFALVLMSLLAGCDRHDPPVRDDAGRSALSAPANERGRLGFASAHASNARGIDMVGPGDELVRVENDMAMANIRDFGAVPDDGLASGARLADGAVDVKIEACEVKNTNGPIAAEGIGIVGSSRVLIEGCQVHHNTGYGIVIGVNGLELPAGQPATHVQVIGGQYFNNGTGIIIESAFDLVPRDIQIIGVTVSNNVNNGITVYAGENIRMEGVTASYNGFGGIVLQDDAAATARIRRIDIIDPNVYDNSISPSNTVGGIIVGGDVDRVTIEGGRVYDDAALPTQLHALQIQSDGALRATNLRIVDVDARGSGAIVQNTYHTVTTPPLSGHYRIQHGGNPWAAPGLAAPVGSHFTDTATGTDYVKTGPGAQDWDEVALVP